MRFLVGPVAVPPCQNVSWVRIPLAGAGVIPVEIRSRLQTAGRSRPLLVGPSQDSQTRLVSSLRDRARTEMRVVSPRLFFLKKKSLCCCCCCYLRRVAQPGWEWKRRDRMRGRASAQVPQAGGIAFQARSTVRRGRLCGYAAGGRDAQKPGCRQEMFHYASMSHRLRKSRSLGPGRPPRTACPIQTRIKKRRTADKVTCRPRSPALASFSSRTGGRYDGSGGPAGFNRRRRERCGEEEEALSDPTLITCADRARRDKWAYNAKRRARDRRQSGDSRPARSRRRSRFFFLLSSWWAVFVGPETVRRARVVSSSSELGPLIARRRLAPVDRVWWRSEIGVARSTQADEGASAPECGMNCVQRCANPRGVPGCRRTRGGGNHSSCLYSETKHKEESKDACGLVGERNWARRRLVWSPGRVNKMQVNDISRRPGVCKHRQCPFAVRVASRTEGATRYACLG